MNGYIPECIVRDMLFIIKELMDSNKDLRSDIQFLNELNNELVTKANLKQEETNHDSTI